MWVRCDDITLEPGTDCKIVHVTTAIGGYKRIIPKDAPVLPFEECLGFGRVVKVGKVDTTKALITQEI